MEFSNGSVKFEVSSLGEVTFCAKQKDGSWGYDYVGTNRVTNTRFLLKCFQQAKEQYKYLYCTAYSKDKKESMRNEIFLRVGFEDRGGEKGGSPLLEWDSKNPQGEELWVGADHPKEGLYVAVATSSFSIEENGLVVTENHYGSGLWKAEMIREKSFNPLREMQELDDNYNVISYSQVEYEGNGFMYPESLPYELKYGAIFRMEKKILHVMKDIVEAGWGVAVALPS